MPYRVVAVLAFVLSGCQFDSSVSLAQADAGEGASGDASALDEVDGDLPVPPILCSSGLSRACGECGSEFCIDGVWSDECVADDSVCDYGSNCLSNDLGAPSCLAACSTEGYQTPFDTGYGLSDAIPDVVDPGDYWLSTDGCNYPGDYRVCQCGFSGQNGAPQVYCDSCDSY